MSAIPWITHGHGVVGSPVPPFVQVRQRPARSGTCCASSRCHTSTIGASSSATRCCSGIPSLDSTGRLPGPPWSRAGVSAGRCGAAPPGTVVRVLSSDTPPTRPEPWLAPQE
jgi:hypothetical protein